MQEKTNPLSTHDLIYHCMDEASRNALEFTLDSLMKKVIDEQRIRFMNTINDSIKQLIDATKYNVWTDYYEYESPAYEFINKFKNDIWKCILASNPKYLSKYDIMELMGAMKANYPKEYHEMIHKEYVERAEAAEKKLKELSLKVIRHDNF